MGGRTRRPPWPRSAALSACARERGSLLAGRDLDPLRLRPRRPRDLDLQDPVLEAGPDVVRANATREGDLASVVAVPDLAAHVVALLAPPLGAAHRDDGKVAVGVRHLQDLGQYAEVEGFDL